MSAARPLLALISLIILAGGILLQFLVILSGGVNSFPENLIYFLQADTTGISGARNPSRWTYWAICGADSNGHNTNCGAPVPALPFSPPHRTNFGTTNGVPPQFVDSNTYYYLSRSMFAFYLIALFFAVVALFTGLLALFSRLGGYISGFNTALALFFQTLTAALMTAWTVMGRNAFRSNGQDARLGVKAYAFTWAAMACFLISMILFCLAPVLGKDKYGGTQKRGGMFGRKRSTRSRTSYVDSESNSAVHEKEPGAFPPQPPHLATRSSYERGLPGDVVTGTMR